MRKLIALSLVLITLLALCACSLPGGKTLVKLDVIAYEDDKCCLTFTDSAQNGLLGIFSVNFTLENKSSLYLRIEGTVSVSGYQVESVFFDEDIKPGSSKNGSIQIFKDDLEGTGVTSYDKVDTLFTITGYSRDYETEETICSNVFCTVYPTGKQPSEVVIPARPSTAAESVLIDNDKFSFTILDFKKGDIFGWDAQVFAQNKIKDKSICFVFSNVMVNRDFDGLLAQICLIPDARYTGNQTIFSLYSFDIVPGVLDSGFIPSTDMEINTDLDMNSLSFSLSVYEYDYNTESYGECLLDAQNFTFEIKK